MITLLAAEGGAGKTLLQQLALTCVAKGLPFLGKATTPGVAAGLFAEDPKEVLHGRQRRICDEVGVDLWMLQGRLVPLSFAGHDAVLWRDGQRTSLCRSIEKQLARITDLRLLAIDNAALVFGDDENDRGSVTRFMSALNGLAARLGAAILLSTHKAKSSDGSTLRAASSSTAWINAARSVLDLSPGNAEQDEAPSLRLLKANHTQPGERLTLRWRNGVLGVDAPAGGLVGAIEQRNAKRVFLDLLAKLNAEGRSVSSNSRAGNYAPKLFADRPDREGFSRTEFARAMEALFSEDAIEVRGYRMRNGRKAERIERVGGGGQNDAPAC
jgi:RecA-family ATPase